VLIGSTSTDSDHVFKAIHKAGPSSNTQTSIAVKPRVSKDEYVEIIEALREHIRKGDCYEINFCQEFFAEDVLADPVSLYRQLSSVSPNPFSGFYKINDKYLLCASPERYLKKEGKRILSQPIKGTTKRILQDKQADEEQRTHLLKSEKDRSENVMIVDLVRNDLSKVCNEGSVTVKDLFGILYVPQCIKWLSTIEGE
jgi:para-aminobenzoate synthetase component 1